MRLFVIDAPPARLLALRQPVPNDSDAERPNTDECTVFKCDYLLVLCDLQRL